jgi:hypothetical protein
MLAKSIIYEWRESDPVFANESYLSSLSNRYGWIAGYINNEIVFLIAFTIRNKFGFRIAKMQMAPFSFGVVVSQESEKEFLNQCIKKLSELQVDFCEEPPPHAVFRVYPDSSIYAPFGSYIVDLERKTELQLWSDLNSKHRNVILNARKKGVEIRIGDSKDYFTVYCMLVETMKRSNLPFISNGAFMKLIDSLGDNVVIFVAYFQSEPIGCGVFPYSKHSAYYQYGGSVSSPVLGAMNLLHWEAIKYFKCRNVKRYDFVGARLQPKLGSKLEGIQRFKRRFGATMEIGFLWKIPITYKYYLYVLLIKIKNFGFKDIIDQEKKREN